MCYSYGALIRFLIIRVILISTFWDNPILHVPNLCSMVLFLVLLDPSPIIGNACHSLTHWLTHSLPFSKLDRCDPGLWKWQLKTCYRTRVRSLAMLVSNWLTDSLTDSCLVNLMAMNVTNCLMMSQQLLKAVTSLWLCLSLTNWLTHWLAHSLTDSLTDC